MKNITFKDEQTQRSPERRLEGGTVREGVTVLVQGCVNERMNECVH